MDPTNKDSKTNDYEKNVENLGADGAQKAFVNAMFTEGGMNAMLNRDGHADANEDELI